MRVGAIPYAISSDKQCQRSSRIRTHSHSDNNTLKVLAHEVQVQIDLDIERQEKDQGQAVEESTLDDNFDNILVGGAVREGAKTNDAENNEECCHHSADQR
jgi:hypothetical protein